jgi:hypothetical protein
MKNLFRILAFLSFIAISGCKKDKIERDFITFEELDPGISGYWNGDNNEGSFSSGNGIFPNKYNNDYSSWSGFSFTNHSDTEAGDYTNMYSSITGEGDDMSSIYSTYYYMGAPDTLKFMVPEIITNISISNSTYAYLTMKNGNMFAKKFGGVDGNDPDWYKLKLTTLGEDGSVTAIETIFLADFRYDNNSQDYISNVWSQFDLSEAGYIIGIIFEIESSDTGDYGINTPAYICVDNIEGILKSNQ